MIVKSILGLKSSGIRVVSQPPSLGTIRDKMRLSCQVEIPE